MRPLPIVSRAPVRCAVGSALAILILAGGADGPADAFKFDALSHRADQLAKQALVWYRRTPPSDRVTWGGLVACAALGLGVATERSFRLRRRRVIPKAFVDRFLDRLRDGKLDQGKGSDLCEMNPSPAARVALAAIRRWGRSAADMERAVALARGVESDRLRRHVGTLRRIAALSPLLGLLGTLLAAGRGLSTIGAGSGTAWGPALATALGPLTVGVALAIVALVAYDGLVGRVEKLTNDLDRLGAETVDAIVLAGAFAPPHPGGLVRIPAGPSRPSHQIRVDDSLSRE